MDIFMFSPKQFFIVHHVSFTITEFKSSFRTDLEGLSTKTVKRNPSPGLIYPRHPTNKEEGCFPRIDVAGIFANFLVISQVKRQMFFIRETVLKGYGSLFYN